MQRRHFLKAASALSVLGSASLITACNDKPRGSPAAGAGTDLPEAIRILPHGSWGTKIANGFMGIVQVGRFVEKEFEKDAVKIHWEVVDGTGPGVNEAIANGLVDFSSYGGLPQIIGRSRGLNTRILVSSGYANGYFAVRSDFPAKSVAELKGATLASPFGTYIHLSTALLLKEYGVDLKDVKLLNMTGGDAVAALAAGRIDGYFGSASMFPLVDQGIARIIYTSQGRKAHTSGFGGFMVTDEFAQRYPDATKRVVKAYLRAMHWVSLPENREEYFRISAQNSTTPIEHVRRDFAGQELSARFNPLVDDYFVERFREAAVFSRDNGIIRNTINVDGWFDRETIRSALNELGWNNHWTAWDAAGNPFGGERNG